MIFWRRMPHSQFILRACRHEALRRPLHNIVNKNINITSTFVNLCPVNNTLIGARYKSNKKKYDDSDDEEDVFDDDSSLSKDSKLVKFSTTSMRTDAILKLALGVARNKIEVLFYESKIRVNGMKIMKKSAAVKMGDEIDVIKMVSPKNPNHLYVARVEILNVVSKDEAISITARRFKNLLIENYEDDPHKAATEETEN